jgi:cell division septum initiation protein DivIVA
MSTADIDLFGPPDEEAGQPRFTTVLRGFDPDQVRGYLLHQATRIDQLEQELEEARGQRDSARRRYSMARDDAYGQLANRMADLLRTADQQADKIRREADESAHRSVEEARKLSEQIVREAEGEAERLRTQGQDSLREAMIQRDDVLGGLIESRDLMLSDLGAARDHLTGIVEQLEMAMAAAGAAEIERAIEELTDDEQSEAAVAHDPLADDLLGRTEAFEIMLPEFMTAPESEQGRTNTEGADPESS